MAVPKKKTSRARRDRRRANHDKVTPPNLTTCPTCGEPRPTHTACWSCGTFKDRQVLDVEEEETQIKK